MTELSFEKYTEHAARAERRRRVGGSMLISGRLPMLKIPAGLAKDQITRPGPDASAVMREAGLVAKALLEQGVPFDRCLAVNHPAAGTKVGAWSLSPPHSKGLYDIRHENRPVNAFSMAHLEPAILGETGSIYFSFHELHHVTGAYMPSEPVVTLRSLGEGTAANEQVRYGLASLVAAHELALAA